MYIIVIVSRCVLKTRRQFISVSVEQLTNKRNKQDKVVSNNNGKLTLWAFAVILGERKVSGMDFCCYLVDPFCAYVYGTEIKTFLNILDVRKVLTFYLV